MEFTIIADVDPDPAEAENEHQPIYSPSATPPRRSRDLSRADHSHGHLHHRRMDTGEEEEFVLQHLQGVQNNVPFEIVRDGGPSRSRPVSSERLNVHASSPPKGSPAKDTGDTGTSAGGAGAAGGVVVVGNTGERAPYDIDVEVEEVDVFERPFAADGHHQLTAVVVGKSDQRQVEDAMRESRKLGLTETGETARKVRIHAKTVHYYAAPEHLKGNEFLVRGYRPQMGIRDALKSAFSSNNETANIWTHASGFIIFFAFLCLIWIPGFFPWPSHYDDTQHQGIFTLFCACVALCCLNSTVYHTFCCVSAKASFRLLMADYLGIVAQIAGSISLLLYYGFYCNKKLQLIYLVSNAVVSSLGMLATLMKKFHESSARAVRAGVFFSIACTSFVPVAHLLAAVGYKVFRENGLDWPFILMGLIYVLGIAVFVSRVPERYCPGVFDCSMHSHAYMHVCTVLGALVTFYGGWKFMSFLYDRDQFTCTRSYW